MSSSSHQHHHSNEQSDNSLRVKFQSVKAQQQQHQSQLIKKPSINLKLLQRSQQYPQLSSSQLSNQQEQQLSSMANFPSNQQHKKKITSQQFKKTQISNFIIKTYRILQDKTNSQIIHWTDEGNSFIVKNKQRFQNQILPKYFKHKKFSSFVRQLNMYDFHKIRKEKEIPIFKHRYFKEGCVDLLSKIRRKSGDEMIAQGDEEDVELGGNVSYCDTKNYIPSLFDLGEKPVMSAMSFKSKSMLPFPSMLVSSQPSIGLLPAVISGGQSSQLDLFIQQNSQLNSSIAELTRQQVALQLQRDKKKEKLYKIFNVLLNCDLNQQTHQIKNDIPRNINSNSLKFDQFTLRDLQLHFLAQQEPYAFCDYLRCMKIIFNDIRTNLVKMNTLQQQQTKQQHQTNQ